MSLPKQDHSSAFDRWLVCNVSRAIGYPPVRFALWDGWEYHPPGTVPRGAVFIKRRSAILKLLLGPELYFGEGYCAGQIDIEGNLPELIETVYRATRSRRSRSWFTATFSRWLEWIQANSISGSRRNIHRHYDIGDSFYQLWLDPQLVYTCAYFTDPGNTLEEAQIAKMDHVCRKLNLRSGDTVVEAGCGWGALALHMARHYGARVKAFNISRNQIDYARRRVRELGLGTQVEFILDDYRNISGKYDAFVSVGMLEHVGLQHYRELGEVIHRSLKDTGRGFIHFIGRNRPMRLSLWTRKHIFPGAFVPTLREAMDLFEEWDFSVLDVENLRLHYARTLEHWLSRFEDSRSKVATMFGPAFVRIWRLYLAGSVAAFRSGSMQLFQIAFARGVDNSIPWTRAHIYAPPDEDEAEGKWFPATS